MPKQALLIIQKSFVILSVTYTIFYISLKFEFARTVLLAPAIIFAIWWNQINNSWIEALNQGNTPLFLITGISGVFFAYCLLLSIRLIFWSIKRLWNSLD